MKLVVSISINIILLVSLGGLWLTHQLSDHYYRKYTGFVLRESAARIEAGKEPEVKEILRQVKGRPTYAELTSVFRKLNAIAPVMPPVSPTGTPPEKAH